MAWVLQDSFLDAESMADRVNRLGLMCDSWVADMGPGPRIAIRYLDGTYAAAALVETALCEKVTSQLSAQPWVDYTEDDITVAAASLALLGGDGKPYHKHLHLIADIELLSAVLGLN